MQQVAGYQQNIVDIPLVSITTLGRTYCKTNTFKNEQFEMWEKSKVDTS